jgi:hypothetical protein
MQFALLCTTAWWACRSPNFAKGRAVGGRGEAKIAMIAKVAREKAEACFLQLLNGTQ